MEIYKRFRLEVVKEKTIKYTPRTIKTAGMIGEEIARILEKTFKVQNQAEEVLYLLTLDGAHQINGLFEVARGALNNCTVHPREIFKRALVNNAAAIILAHNHPSGSTEPSHQDKDVTERIKTGGEMLGIKLVDHVILGGYSHYSFAEQGRL